MWKRRRLARLRIASDGGCRGEEVGYDGSYGFTICIGNSGDLDASVAEAITANDLIVAAVLSGNRNFEGRIHPLTRANYLASPPLVVAYTLAGTIGRHGRQSAAWPAPSPPCPHLVRSLAAGTPPLVFVRTPTPLPIFPLFPARHAQLAIGAAARPLRRPAAAPRTQPRRAAYQLPIDPLNLLAKPLRFSRTGLPGFGPFASASDRRYLTDFSYYGPPFTPRHVGDPPLVCSGRRGLAGVRAPARAWLRPQAWPQSPDLV
ncbi:hypothetical protein PR202_ga17098 [Eleusine coracana subsp. coracana]|uniref:Aconitase/3-isopropylmalate dehydratase large subunit alpha/beta/alpha domain-containing protein n=1 Tax=Eleusine coracana subsp. coracana TaxID=191504 RepID=A0AAV5CPD8_ELECO|nr:hypothetical protein PR202_ga17098 [Eleusine coracana subsp. coracana]